MAEYKIKTLSINSEEDFSFMEYAYLKALHYTIEKFEGIEKDVNALQIYIGDKAFVIASHDKNETINPFAFVTEKGNIEFNTDIVQFKDAIREFETSYYNYYNKNSELSREQIARKAIEDYKNDKLDFYSNRAHDLSQIIVKAREMYSSNQEKDMQKSDKADHDHHTPGGTGGSGPVETAIKTTNTAEKSSPNTLKAVADKARSALDTLKESTAQLSTKLDKVISVFENTKQEIAKSAEQIRSARKSMER